MSMAFRKPFGNSKDKVKSPEPTYPSSSSSSSAPVLPPAYSMGGLGNERRSSKSGPVDQSRRLSAGRSNKPVPHQSEGLVPRRSHIGAGAVGTSPPLPPLPRNGSIEGLTDPRVSELLQRGPLASDNFLPSNSFGPAFEVPSIEGLGIGMEKLSRGAQPPRQQTPTPPRAFSPPPAFSHSSHQQPPPQQHYQPPAPQQYYQQQPPPQQQQFQQASPPRQQYQQPIPSQPTHQHNPYEQYSYASAPQARVGSPPALARSISPAPEPEQQTYLHRRRSLLASSSEPSAASKRLSMMRRGPPVFDVPSANSSTSTFEMAAVAEHAIAQLATSERSTSPDGAPPPAQLLDEDEVASSLSAASRDRIAKLRGSKTVSATAAVVSAPSSPAAVAPLSPPPSIKAPLSPPPPAPAAVVAPPPPVVAPVVLAAAPAVPPPIAKPTIPLLRGANRRDFKKAYSLASVPQGFDVNLVKSGKSTFTPFNKQFTKPLPSTSSSSVAHPSHLGPPATAAKKPVEAAPPAAPSKDLYVLRPTVTMGTQTPDWSDFPSPSNWHPSDATPPLTYGTFPGPPSHHPHDFQLKNRANISPSIYSVASFDVRKVPHNHQGRVGRTSYYEQDDEFDEEEEYRYDAHEAMPEGANENIERYAERGDGEGYSADHSHDEGVVGEEPINYDVPYLTNDVYDTPHLRPFEMPATPLPTLDIPDQPSPALTATGGGVTPTGDLTPSVSPTPYAVPSFSNPSPFKATADLAALTLSLPDSPRTVSSVRSASPPSRSDTPIGRIPQSRPLSVASVTSVASSNALDTSSSRPPSSLAGLSDRRSSAEQTTPPTSAVSSIFAPNDLVLPEAVKEKEHEVYDGSASEAEAEGEGEATSGVVMIRRVSIVTSQVRKASLVSVTPPASRPQSMVARKASFASLQNDRRLSTASSDGGSTSPNPNRSPRLSKSVPNFQLDLPGAGDVPAIPAIPSPIRREFGEAAFPFPFPLSATSTSNATEKQDAAAKEVPQDQVRSPASPPPVFTSTLQAPASPSPLRTPSTFSTADFDAPSPPVEPLLAPIDFSLARPASAPPEESASLPLRRQSESDTAPIARARTPGGVGMVSREERAAKSRSYFLVRLPKIFDFYPIFVARTDYFRPFFFSYLPLPSTASPLSSHAHVGPSTHGRVAAGWACT